jgi:hypothetical protein
LLLQSQLLQSTALTYVRNHHKAHLLPSLLQRKFRMTMIIMILINYLFPTSVKEVEEGQELLVDLVRVMRAFVVELDLDLPLLLLDHPITLQTTTEH